MAARALLLSACLGACLIGAQAATTPSAAPSAAPTTKAAADTSTTNPALDPQRTTVTSNNTIMAYLDPKSTQEEREEIFQDDLQKVVPTGYSIQLKLLHESVPTASQPLEDWSYNLTGSVTIAMICRDSTDRVQVAAGKEHLQVLSATISSTDTEPHPAEVHPFPDGRSYVTLILPFNLTAGLGYNLNISFTRTINTWILSKYSSHSPPVYSGLVIQPGSVSQFIPVLNGSDPSGKVNVDLNVTHRANYTVLSSARPLRQEPLPGDAAHRWATTVFEQTQLIDMKHFGLFVSCEFDLANETTTLRLDSSDTDTEESWRDVRVRIWGRTAFKRALVYASQLSPEAICYAQCYLGLPFPTNSLELITHPYTQGTPLVGSSIAFFRESDMVPDGQLEGLLVVLSRVIVEQYVGVIVTPLKDSRLVSQAIVNYVASEMVRALRPRELAKEHASVSKGSKDTEPAANNSATISATNSPTASPASANNSANATCKCDQYEGDKSDVLVNAIYSVYYELGSQFPLSNLDLREQRPALQATKTELVLRMLAITLGERTFKAALKTLVEDRKGSYFSAEGFWEILTKQAFASQSLEQNLSVKSIVDSWISRDRLPLLTVTRTPDNNANLTQSVFRRRVYDPEERPDPDKDSGLVWTIPIVTLTEGEKFSRVDHPPRLWMTDRTVLLENASHGDSFLIVNPEETAPCIVNYDKRNWELVSNALNDRREPVLPPRTRAKLLHDAVMLAHAGELEFGDALPLLRSLEREVSPAVWQPVGNVLDHLRRDVEGTRLELKFKTFLESMLRAALEHVETLLNKEGPVCACEQRQLNETRNLVLHQLSRANMKPCITEAREAYTSWAASEDRDQGIPMSESQQCCLFQWGTDEEFAFGIERLEKFSPSKMRNERLLLGRDLAGCPRQSERRLKVLEVILKNNESQYSDEDQRNVMLYASGRGNDLFKFFVDNMDYLSKKYSKDNKLYLWESLVLRACTDLKSKEDISMMKELIVRHGKTLRNARRIVSDCIKKAEINVAWAEKAFPSMEAWLDKYLINQRKD